MTLNKKQKQFLFDKGYVTAKTLDAAIEEGWKDYFMDCYDWDIEGTDYYGFTQLFLTVNSGFEKGEVHYKLGLNFHNNDYDKLIALR